MRLPLSKKNFVTIISTYAPTMNWRPSITEIWVMSSEEFQQPTSWGFLVISIRVQEAIMSSMDQRLTSSENADAIRMANFYRIFARTLDSRYKHIFQSARCTYFTWDHPRPKKSHLLDCTLPRHKHKSDILDTKDMRDPECATDHYICGFETSFPLDHEKQKRTTGTEKI